MKISPLFVLSALQFFTRFSVGLALIGSASTVVQARQIEEVEVTAQRIGENVQDVPISLTVVGSEELAELNIFDFAETAALTPGVDFTPGILSSAIRIRGVGPSSFTLTAPQSVAVFVDEFPQISIGAVFSTLVDVERIEVLKGPQGTLYGLNAPGGAYNITTRAPETSHVEGYFGATYSTFGSRKMDGVDIRGAVNLPIIRNTLGLRLAGVFAESDGFVKVVNPTSGANTIGGKKHKSLRSRLLWVVNPDIDLTWNVKYNDLEDSPVNEFNIEGLVPGSGSDFGTPPIFNQFKKNRYYGDVVPHAASELLDTSVHFRMTADVFDVDFLAAFQQFDNSLLDNRGPYLNDYFPALIDLELDSEQTNLELRLSNSGDTLDYIAGVFYNERDLTKGFFDINISGANLVGPATGSEQSISAFTNLTFHLSDNWDLLAGARYDNNKVETRSSFSFVGLQSLVDDDLEFNNLSWSFKLRHFLNDNTTAYLALDRASKLGGFNNLTPALARLIPLLPDLEELAQISEEMLAFDDETSTAFEIGVKGTALNGTMTYGAALFYQEYEDYQLTQAVSVSALSTALGDLNTLFTNQLVNAEEVSTKGVELDASFLIGDYWSVGTRVSYTDPDIEKWRLRLCPVGEEESATQLICPAGDGKRLSGLPHWSTNTQVGYTRPLSQHWLFYGNVNWSWHTSRNSSDARQSFDPYQHLAFTLGFTSLKTGFDLRLWGKNITNNHNFNPKLENGLDDTLIANSLAGAFTFYRPGPEYGITLTYGFGVN